MFRECRIAGEKLLNEWKANNLPVCGGILIAGDNFTTGSLLITRGSVKGVVGHTLNLAVRSSLLDIRTEALKYEYLGWRECKAHPDSGLRKHPEAAFFLYYKVEIAGQTYFPNVKAHRGLKAEVLYCIRDRCNFETLRREDPPAVNEW